MSAEDIIKTRGTLKSQTEEAGGAVLVPYPCIGIVKNNVDKTRSGKIKVYLKIKGASGNQEDPNSWTEVSYMSPFFGATPNDSSSNDLGKYAGNPHSYGIWATPPDLDTEVVCVFLNGSLEFGYYIGCVPPIGMTHMVPAIAASDKVIANSGEAESYGGATRLPVAEINNANKKLDSQPTFIDQARPVHSYQAAILNKQGLIRDPDRGTIGSSSLRESPSRVFGISTPGRPIYRGGYDDQTIADAVKNSSIPDKNFGIIGRRGGHSIVMDDGDIVGKDQLVRIRTAQGHQIMMNDSAQTLFIIHANGQSYVELGKEGTIDMYSTNSVNIRTQGDLNLHADNNINMHATKDFNLSAENIRMESGKETTQLIGSNFKQHTKGELTSKVDGKMSYASGADSSFLSSAITYINGSKINLNTGASGLVPQAVKPIPLVAHTDTLFDDKKGYAPAPGKLQSITSRAPAHSPWANANQGVNVPSNLSASAAFPPAPSPALSQVNRAIPDAPETGTTPAVAATVTPTAGVSRSLTPAVTSSLLSQSAVNAATGPTADAVSAAAGVVTSGGAAMPAVGPFALNADQLEASGLIKPGAAALVNGAIQSGTRSLSQSIPQNVLTGKDGVTSIDQLIRNIPAQAGAMMNLLGQGEKALISAGLIDPSESPTQTAGPVLAAATAGITRTLEFAKGVIGNEATGSAIASTLAGGAGLDVAKLTSGADLTAGLSSAGLKLNATGEGLKMPESFPDIKGSVSDLMAAGKLAATMADKTLSGLGGVTPPGDQLQGAVAGVFGSVTAAFKPFASGEPVNLTELKKAAEELKAATEAANLPTATPADINASLTRSLGLNSGGSLRTTLESAGAAMTAATSNAESPGDAIARGTSILSGLATSAVGAFGGDTTDMLSGIPGGAASINSVMSYAPELKRLAESATAPGGAVGSVVDSVKNLGGTLEQTFKTMDVPGVPSVPGIPNVPGGADLSKAIGGVLSAVKTGLPQIQSIVGGLESKMASVGDGLESLASTGLGSADAAKLAGAISSVGTGGSTEVRLPSVGTQTFDFGPMAAQAKLLLGDAKIPAINFGGISANAGKPVSADQIKAYDELKVKLAAKEDQQWDLRKAYLDAKGKYGPEDPKTITANEAWKACLADIEQIKAAMQKSVGYT
jgi:hypothetical protein